MENNQNNYQNNYEPQPQQNYEPQPQYAQPQYNQPADQQYYQQQYQQPVDPQYNQQPYYQGQPIYVVPTNDNSKGMAITSLVLSILSFFCCGFPFSIAGFIFGLVSKSRKPQNNPLATAGIVISIIGFVVTIIALISLFASGTFTDLVQEIRYY